jgi:hypothetical protein
MDADADANGEPKDPTRGVLAILSDKGSDEYESFFMSSAGPPSPRSYLWPYTREAEYDSRFCIVVERVSRRDARALDHDIGMQTYAHYGKAIALGLSECESGDYRDRPNIFEDCDYNYGTITDLGIVAPKEMLPFTSSTQQERPAWGKKSAMA